MTVIQAAALTEGNDLFMLDMGQCIRIEDLACRLIRLRGLRPGVDVPIVYTGIRPGEKLHEELLEGAEMLSPTLHPQIFRVQNSQHLDCERLQRSIAELVALAERQKNAELVQRLWELVLSLSK